MDQKGPERSSPTRFAASPEDEKDADVATAVPTAVLEKASPPPELFSVLGITDVAGLVDLLNHHNHRQIVRDR